MAGQLINCVVAAGVTAGDAGTAVGQAAVRCQIKLVGWTAEVRLATRRRRGLPNSPPTSEAAVARVAAGDLIVQTVGFMLKRTPQYVRFWYFR